LNPIEKGWFKRKQYLRAAKARTAEALDQAITEAIKTIAADNVTMQPRGSVIVGMPYRISKNALVARYRTTTRARGLQRLPPQLLQVSKVQDVDPQQIHQAIHGFGAEAATCVEDIRHVGSGTTKLYHSDQPAEVDLAKEYSLPHVLGTSSTPHPRPPTPA
jgi:hypothetical protein